MKKILTFFPFTIFSVVGNSMYPTYKDGERVVVQQWFVSPAVSDIIVLKDPRNGRLILKRVTKVKDIQEKSHKWLHYKIHVVVRFIAQREYFVEGDNRDESTDSRYFGWVKRSQVIGRVI